MRLIDADALKKAIKEAWETPQVKIQILKIIDNTPTVEITKPQSYCMGFADGLAAQNYEKPPMFERPQGEWKTNLTTGDIFCSCCKEVRRDTRIKHINFCNSCGADMRGGAK